MPTTTTTTRITRTETSLATRLKATLFIKQTLKQIERYRDMLPPGIYQEMLKELSRPQLEVEMDTYFADRQFNPETGHARTCCCKDCYCAAMELRAFNETEHAHEA